MRLRSIEIDDFRGLGHVALDFLHPTSFEPLPVIVIVGENGSGKSSFTRALTALLSAHVPEYAVRAEHDRDWLPSALGDRGLIVDSDVRRGARRARVAAQFDDVVFARQPISLAMEHPPTGSPVTNSWVTNVRSGTPRGVGVAVAFDAHRLIPPTAVAGPNIERIARTPIEGALAPTFDRAGDLNRRFGRLEQWIVNIDFQRAKAKADRSLDLPAWTQLRVGLDTMLAPYRFAGVSDAFKVMFETPTGVVELGELSDGFRSIFVIVSELMMRLSLSTDDPERMLEREALCIVDEIDAHLHPKWQQRIVPGLRALFPRVQFVLTTHSPLVVESVLPENVFKLVEVDE